MRFRKIILISAAIMSVLGLSSCAKNTSKTFVVTEYGAIGDAKALNTAAINKTLADCAKRAAARLRFRRGYFARGR